MIDVVSADGLVTVQDLGRFGHAALGVGRAGAFDRGALRLANRLVGNPAEAAGLELTLGEVRLRVRDAVTLALTGARRAGIDWATAVSVPAGTLLRLHVPPAGLRSYLAVRGGVAAELVLGSRSTDTLSGLGPAPVTAGTRLDVGPEPGEPVSSAFASSPGTARGGLRILPGPRDDWFAPEAITLLRTASWTVRAESNRIGVRLDGPRLPRAWNPRTERGEPGEPGERGEPGEWGELPSEATLPGALQVPPDGRPILLGPDAPVTGGYPVIAVVLDADLDAVAQLRPGDAVRFS